MRIFKQTTLAIIITALTGTVARAQLDPLAAQYFTNPYLVNPSLAGTGQGFRINAAYRKLWTNIPGSPQVQNLTAEYGFGKVGLGINLSNETAGIQRQTRVMGSYAYHLPLNEDDQHLNFGISLGFMNQNLDNSLINGDPGDQWVGQYNSRKTYLDGDFGVAFTSNRLNVQAAIPNLKHFFKKDVIKLADVSTFFTALSYRIPLTTGPEGIEFEPKVAWRGIQGFDNIWDAGGQLSLADKQVMLMGLYHSTQSSTFGIGMDYKRKYLITGLYTTQTSGLSNYSNGSFELNLRLNISKQ